jgi:hypothetical protein
VRHGVIAIGGLGLVMACGDPGLAAEAPAPVVTMNSSSRLYRVEELDRVVSLAFEIAGAQGRFPAHRQEALREALDRASDADFASLPVAARVAAQNDVWGLWQQLREARAPQDLQRAAARLVLALSVRLEELPLDDGTIPIAVTEAIGPGPYHERSTELAVLGHEWDYGMRRIFRFVGGPGGTSAMFSQLVALDPSGQPHLTSIVGEIEQLHRGEHDGDIRAANVFELDREALAGAAERPSLRAVDPLAHIPADGANHFVAAFDPPVPLRDVPCRECHADDHIHGRPLLPTDDDPAPRRATLLREHPALSANVESDLPIALRHLLDSAS